MSGDPCISANTFFLLRAHVLQGVGLDFTVIHLNPDKIPGDKREPFYLHKYQRTLCGDYSLKKGNNVYVVHYPCIDGTSFRHESTFVIHFLSGKFI